MTNKKADTKADTKADMELPIDRGEDPSMMEPLYISESSARRSKLNDLAIELASRSAGFRRSLAREEVPEILGSTERHARRLSSELISRGILVSSSSRAPLHLNFPAALASRWIPALFPDKG